MELVLKEIKDDIQNMIESTHLDGDDLLYDAQITIESIVEETHEAVYDAVLSKILHKYGLEIQNKFKSTGELDEAVREFVNDHLTL